MSLKGVMNKTLCVDDYGYLPGCIVKGKVVYKYTGYTYGLISRDGVAVSDQPGETPFYEVPGDSVDWQGVD